MPDDWRQARAGLGYGILVFFATVVVGALLYIVVQPFVTDVLDITAQHADTTNAADGNGYIRSLWTWSPLIILAMAAFYVLVRATRERRVPR